MKVFITGATGFIGLNILQALLEAGHEPVCYVRATSNTIYLNRFPVVLRYGDLNDILQIKRAMMGCDAVIHAAGMVSFNRWDLPQLTRVNVDGTRNLVNAALACGIQRFVYTSTSSTIGAHNTPHGSWNENTPLEGFRARSPFGRTMALAEKVILDAQSDGLRPIILNPTKVIGPFDHNLHWGRLILAVCANKIPFVPPGSGSFCSAKAVAGAHVKALSQGEIGSKYLLAGVHSSYQKFLECAAEITGCFFSVGAADIQQYIYDAEEMEKNYFETGIAPPLASYRMKVFKGHYLFDCSRAEEHLEFHSDSLEEMIRQAYDWYLAQGYVEIAKNRSLDIPTF